MALLVFRGVFGAGELFFDAAAFAPEAANGLFAAGVRSVVSGLMVMDFNLPFLRVCRACQFIALDGRKSNSNPESLFELKANTWRSGQRRDSGPEDARVGPEVKQTAPFFALAFPR